MGSYRALPLSRPYTGHLNNSFPHENSALPEDEDDEIEDFYRVPLRAHRSNKSSISSLADFINGPGRPKKPRSRTSNNSRSVSRSRDGRIKDEEVLFDDNESTAYASSSRGHSRGGTEDSTAINTDDERASKIRY